MINLVGPRSEELWIRKSSDVTGSKALLAIDRANDVSQCWDGVDYKEKDLALDWCRKKVNTYLGKYTFGMVLNFK